MALYIYGYPGENDRKMLLRKGNKGSGRVLNKARTCLMFQVLAKIFTDRRFRQENYSKSEDWPVWEYMICFFEFLRMTLRSIVLSFRGIMHYQSLLIPWLSLYYLFIRRHPLRPERRGWLCFQFICSDRLISISTCFPASRGPSRPSAEWIQRKRGLC